jgi:NADH-quinone oxidoreductase subunit G
MFLTETAALADVILPAANLYEKSGSVTNSYGDLQQVKKAADRAGVRTDFEMIVRIADKMGADMRKLVPFGRAANTGGTRADMGQSRGAQSGEADRHAVWLTANNLEPRLSPFDPAAILDEIQRLVPGYKLLRLQLLSGNAPAPSTRRRRAASPDRQSPRPRPARQRHPLHLRHARPLLRHAHRPATQRSPHVT